MVSVGNPTLVDDKGVSEADLGKKGFGAILAKSAKPCAPLRLDREAHPNMGGGGPCSAPLPFPTREVAYKGRADARWR